MKFYSADVSRLAAPSLPVRGAWVEISAFFRSSMPPKSLPVRGAWVEILTFKTKNVTRLVAPRAGSVG